MKIRAQYEHGSVFVGGNEYYFQNYVASVPDHVGKFLLSRGNYIVEVVNKLSLRDANRLLFVRSSGLGDVMLCVPIIRYIKKNINSRVLIDWLCGSGEFSSVLDGVPWINKVYNRETLPSNVSDIYNYIIPIDLTEFADNKSFTEHRINVFASRIQELKDVKIEDKHLEYYVKDDEYKWIDHFNIKRPYIVMITQTTCFNRVFEDNQNKEICRKILDKGMNVVLIDKNRQDFYDKRTLNLQGKLDIRQVGVIIHEANAVLTPDTGLMHLAAAMDKLILAYFGAIDPKLRTTSKNTLVITNPMKCFPCNIYSCHNGRPDCVRGLNLDAIVEKVCTLAKVGVK